MHSDRQSRLLVVDIYCLLATSMVGCP